MSKLLQLPQGAGPLSQGRRQTPRHLLRRLSLSSQSVLTAARSHTLPLGSAPTTVPTQHRLAAPSVQAMDCLAALFASHIRAGDCYCLFGAVGAGKSVFSRAFIRAVAEDDFLPVPSPTFLLQNTYDEHQGPPIHHFDFYRLSSIQDFNRLDLEGSLTRAVCLMEWPERLPSLPLQCLAVQIEVVDDPVAALQVLTASAGASTPMPGSPYRRSSLTPARGRAFAVEGSYDSDGECSFGHTTCNPEDVDTEAEAEDFTDRRPRLVTLTPYGSYWEGRARRIISYISAHSHACDGLVVLEEGSDSSPVGSSSLGSSSPSSSSTNSAA